MFGDGNAEQLLRMQAEAELERLKKELWFANIQRTHAEEINHKRSGELARSRQWKAMATSNGILATRLQLIIHRYKRQNARMHNVLKSTAQAYCDQLDQLSTENYLLKEENNLFREALVAIADEQDGPANKVAANALKGPVHNCVDCGID